MLLAEHAGSHGSQGGTQSLRACGRPRRGRWDGVGVVVEVDDVVRLLVGLSVAAFQAAGVAAGQAGGFAGDEVAEMVGQADAPVQQWVRLLLRRGR